MVHREPRDDVGCFSKAGDFAQTTLVREGCTRQGFVNPLQERRLS